MKNQRWDYYFPTFSVMFQTMSAYEATRECRTLASAAGVLPRMIADAYMMGGEL